jgi:PAS domain S-box-containing protein
MVRETTVGVAAAGALDTSSAGATAPDTAALAKATLLQIAGRVAQFGGWRVDLARNQVFWSDEVAAIHDRPPGYTLPLEEGISYYAPEWRGRITAVFGACAREGTPFDEEMELITARGRRVWVRVLGEAIRDASGTTVGVQGAFQDISERKRTELVTAARVRLLRLASDHTLAELLRDTLDEAEALTGSQVGFYHFVEPDGATLSLQAWSTNTVQHMCRAQGAGAHYPLQQAGVWVDCVHERRPVIHNDYASLPHRKGLPEGHAPVIRELVVPVLRGALIVAVLGVGNKPTDYDAQDVKSVADLADLAWDIAQRKQAEEKLRESEELFRTLAILAPVGIYLTTPEGHCKYANPRWCEMAGMSLEEARGDGWTRGLHPDDRAGVIASWQRMVAACGQWGLEYRFVTTSGKVTWVYGTAVVQNDVQGKLLGYVGINTDITARKRAEEEREQMQARLLQAQKMESVGRLAGGVAHEFNNKLMGIMNYVELCRDELPPQHPVRSYLDEMSRDARHSADIARQILAFARRQTLAPKALDLNTAVAGMCGLLRSLLGAGIELVWRPGAALWTVRMDPAQLNQVLVNLCTNAQEAIADVGSVTLETANLTWRHEDGALHANAHPGEYVRLRVSDTGRGMGAEVLGQVFEPFFTTKEVGQGSGLGLPSVQGIVEQHGGFVEVHSEVGKGTAFSIFLPRLRS